MHFPEDVDAYAKNNVGVAGKASEKLITSRLRLIVIGGMDRIHTADLSRNTAFLFLPRGAVMDLLA